MSCSLIKATTISDEDVTTIFRVKGKAKQAASRTLFAACFMLGIKIYVPLKLHFTGTQSYISKDRTLYFYIALSGL
jgi:hypothetical protein